MLHIAILHEASEKHGGKALPPELCLAILLRWGGLRHPTASLFDDTEFRYSMMGCSRVANGGGDHGCICGFNTAPELARASYRTQVRALRLNEPAFRPTRPLASHIRRITHNAEGGYRSRSDQTLDKYGQAWCTDPTCGLHNLWWRVWKHREGVMLAWTRQHCHAREFSLVEFLKRAPVSRLESDLAEYTGDPLLFHTNPDEWEWLCSSCLKTDQNDGDRCFNPEYRPALARAYMRGAVPIEYCDWDDEEEVEDLLSRIKPKSASEAAAAPE